MKHVFFGIAILLTGMSAFPAWAEDFSGYAPIEGEWVVGTEDEIPTYPSLDEAKAQKNTDEFIGIPPLGTAYKVLAREGQWLQLEYPDKEQVSPDIFWVEADKTMPVEEFFILPDVAERIPFCESSLPDKFTLDLDDTHKNVTVTIDKLTTVEGGVGFMTVRDGSRVLWTSKLVNQVQDFFDNTLVCTEMGSRWVQAAGNITGAGVGELIVKAYQSEMSPAMFTILRWEKKGDGGEFRETAKDLAFFWAGEGKPEVIPVMVDESDFYEAMTDKYGMWLDTVVRAEGDGTLVAGLIMYDSRESRISSGEALVKIEKNGSLRILRWLKELQVLEE